MNEVEDHFIKESPVNGCRCSWCEAARRLGRNPDTVEKVRAAQANIDNAVVLELPNADAT